MPIDLLDVDKNSAVVSYSACDVEVQLYLHVIQQLKFPIVIKTLNCYMYVLSFRMATFFWLPTDAKLTQQDWS